MSAAVASALGISTKVTRILFVVAALFGGIGAVIYAAMWLFVPDEYGRIVIQGGAADRKEATWAAIFSGLASTTLSWWTFDGTGFLIPLLIGVGVWFLASRPETGTASRPETGTASRPETGTASRPEAGPASRPRQGRVTRAVLPFLPFPRPPSSPMASTATTTPVPPAPAWPDTVADQGRYDSPPLPDAADAGARLSSIPPGGGRPVAIAPVPPRERRPKAPPFVGPLTVGVAVLVAGVLTLLNALGVVDVQTSTILASVLAVVGAGLLVSAWMGRAHGLILLGIVLIPVVGVATIADRIDLRGGFGQREHTPTEVSEVQSEYRLGAGSQTVDLTALDLDEGDDPPPIELSQGAGRIRLYVPRSWTVEADIDIDAGELDVYRDGQLQDRPDGGDPGIDRHLVLRGTSDSPTLDVDVDMTVGLLEVHRES